MIDGALSERQDWEKQEQKNQGNKSTKPHQKSRREKDE